MPEYLDVLVADLRRERAVGGESSFPSVGYLMSLIVQAGREAGKEEGHSVNVVRCKLLEHEDMEAIMETAFLDGLEPGGTYNKQLETMLQQLNPKVLAYSFVTTPIYPVVVAFDRASKKINPDLLSMAGGPHITALPELAIQHGIDFAVCGEAYTTIKPTINRILSKRYEILRDRRSGINPKDNIIRPGVGINYSEVLNSLPYQHDDAISIYKDPDGNVRRVQLTSSNGCDGGIIAKQSDKKGCKFCGDYLGIDPVQMEVFRLFEETKNLYDNYGARFFFFNEPTAIFKENNPLDKGSSLNRWLQYIDYIEKNNMTDLLLRPPIRTDTFSQIYGISFELLARVFQYSDSVGLGVETLQNDRLTEFKNTTATRTLRALEGLQRLTEYKLSKGKSFLGGVFMVTAFPNDTPNQVEQDFEYLKNTYPDIFVSQQLLTPFPGTTIFDDPSIGGKIFDKHELLSGEEIIRWLSFTGYHPTWQHPNMSVQVMKNLSTRLNDKYMTPKSLMDTVEAMEGKTLTGVAAYRKFFLANQEFHCSRLIQ